MSKISLTTLHKMKQDGEKIAMITAYDATFSRLFDDEGVHSILVGDSLGMVVQGHSDTLPVTMDDMVYHTANAARGIQNALLIADLPFMSYSDVQSACMNAARLMAAGAKMVKIEGGAWLADTIKQLNRNGIPVCAHLGLTPQSVHVFGGFRIQGRDAQRAEEIYHDALALQAAGAQMVVLECIPAPLAGRITKALRIPVIGIGAGAQTDGQVLVMQDAIGITSGYIPKFSKNFLAATGDVRKAIQLYVEEVRSGAFPADEHTFN